MPYDEIEQAINKLNYEVEIATTANIKFSWQEVAGQYIFYANGNQLFSHTFYHIFLSHLKTFHTGFSMGLLAKKGSK